MISSELEKAPCALCGGIEFAELFKTRDYLYGVPGEFSISRCKSCSLVSLNPRIPEEHIASLYPDNYEPYSMSFSQEMLSKLVAEQEGRRMLLERHAHKGFALDVGSGDGRFLLCLKQTGWRVAGCELSEKSAAFQRDSLGLDVKAGSLLSSRFDSEIFDAVTFWSVFEHLYDPVETLAEAKRVLKPGGVIAMSMPNFDSLERMLFRTKWFCLQPPFHIYHYSPKVMKRIVAETGMNIEKVYYSTTATSLINSMRIAKGSSISVQSAENANDATPIRISAPESRIKQFAKNTVFDCAIVPALRFADSLRLGAYTNYVLRKT
ncbi:MAG TPA: class I SAM-dependent methyltransferase [bacterium]|nr:MAG: putative S-adenosylmethionine-dependent methyltransferase [bacterium ADurb.Bin236]HOY62533.1 class I SAM-dependent methyltransferase [bacterium]HPI78010.1 class I SAM-dependent methyltransferase [bacterium]